MKELVAVKLPRIPHLITFHEESLKSYRNAEQLSFALTTLRIRAEQFVQQVPCAAHSLAWPPPFGLLPDVPRGSPVLSLYLLMFDTVRICGFPISALQDIEVVSHDPKKTTVLELDGRRRLVAVQ